MRFAAAAAAAAVFLAVSACGDPSDSTVTDTSGLQRVEGDAGSVPQSLGVGEAAESAPAAPAPVSASGSPQGAPGGVQDPFGADLPTSMVIRTGNASIEVDSLEPAIAAIRRLAARVGGYVGNTAVQAGDESVRSASLELRVPSDRFDEVVSGLSPVGEIEHVNVHAEDVGEQYVDLSARAENGRRLESRLVELLAARTGKLGDVLAVERELARVREEIERIDGRMRYLRTRADMSSLSVMVHEPGPLVGVPGDHPIADAFRQAWRNAVAFLAWLIAAAGVLVPVAVLAGGGVLLWRRWWIARKPVSA